jgi:two-component system, LuxR family, response regulator FixJ
MIYFIDDDTSVLRGFQILLKSASLECCVFDSVEEFLCKWSRKEDDILILDIHLPGINGCDLLDYLEKRNLKIPVIIITAHDQPESRSSSDKYGVMAYLTKPVDSEILLEKINNHLINQTDIAIIKN